MKIKADKEGIETMKSLCDLALKAGGLQNFMHVKRILENLEELEDGKD